MTTPLGSYPDTYYMDKYALNSTPISTNPLVYNGGGSSSTGDLLKYPSNTPFSYMPTSSQDGGMFQYITPGETAGAGFGGLAQGLAVAPQGTDALSAGFDVLGAMAGGGIAGAAGGPVGIAVGAGVGGLVGLGKAYFSVTANRKRERERKRMIKVAEEAQRKAVARDEKWKQLTRMDTLEGQAYTRNKAVIQQGWMDYQNKMTIMDNFMNQNTKARDSLFNLLQPTRA